MIEFNWW